MRLLTDSLKARFEDIHATSVMLLEIVTDETLYQKPVMTENPFIIGSVGEYLLRSSAVIEQTFNGITTRLWDDPFEWTLPERLSSVGAVRAYIDEADQAAERGFRFITDDEDLKRSIPAPTELKTLFNIILETIYRAAHFQGRAFSLFQVVSETKLPKID